MKDVNHCLSLDRRTFLKTGGTAAVASLAGCSGNGDGNSEPADTETSTEQSGNGGGNDTTATETNNSNTETSERQQTEDPNNSVDSLLEEDEPEAEERYESRLFGENIYPNEAWIEMENPPEQIPEENLDYQEFPNLRIFEEEKEDIELYSDKNEAVYLSWVELDGRISLGPVKVKNYENPDKNYTSDGSHQYTDKSANVGRILDQVIEDVDDVSENISEEYSEILRNS